MSTAAETARQPRTKPLQAIRIVGARTHNLRNLSLEIPHGQLVALSGKSGSGKSSLALDTLFAEGQRQYVETLSTYARQFFDQLQRPDVDLIEGLPPTICIDQHFGRPNARSTVATTTEIYDFLRVLFARLGDIACHQCGQPIRQQSVEQIQDILMQLPEGTKAIIMAPVVRGRKGQHQDELATIRKAGLVRVRIDGQLHDLDQAPPLDARKPHTIEAVVDRIIVKPGVRARLAESIGLAVKIGAGLAAVCYLEAPDEAAAKAAGQATEGLWKERLFSTLYACPDCQVSLEEVEPRTFSFNSPYGACPACSGVGTREEFDPELVLPSEKLSLAGGGAAPWKGLKGAALKKFRAELEPFFQRQGAALDAPLETFSSEFKRQLLGGEGDPTESLPHPFLGLQVMLEKELATAVDDARRAELESYRGLIVCQACQGARLRREALGVRLGGRTIYETVRQSVSQAKAFFAGLKFGGEDRKVAQPLLEEIVSRLGFLEEVGLAYLTLDRASDSLSGGELQRVRMAAAIGSGLAGVCYILDEPSVGLHARDSERLIASLRKLKRLGSTVVVVEHDESVLRAADRLIDIGPGAGKLGGRILAEGTPAEVAAEPESLTGGYLSGRLRIEPPAERRVVNPKRAIVLEGATGHNLKNVTATIPLGALVVVSGVSGSGKSTLIHETLARALVRRLGNAAPRPEPYVALRGAEQIDRLVEIDQSPLGRSPRSNAATYTGVWDEIRKVFAATKEAKQYGFSASRFSFNSAGGRCEACQGQGVQRIEMNFLPDLFVRCGECGGSRFNRQTLLPLYRGRNIAQILELPIGEAVELFENFAHIQKTLLALRDVGLGYLSLGQAANTLSGGEAQRIKLAAELARGSTGATLYLLDEPTTGLHTDDVRLLLAMLQRLVDMGNTVLIVEHHLDVIRCADWVLDLGPDGGDGGGELLFSGPPSELVNQPRSITGRYLRE